MGSALPAIDALPSCDAISKAPRAAGYRGSDFVHWYVDSKATVALIKGAFEELKAAPKIGRAEALRRSIFALIDKGPERFAHPAAWAPFVVVGEGGPGKAADFIEIGITAGHGRENRTGRPGSVDVLRFSCISRAHVAIFALSAMTSHDLHYGVLGQSDVAADQPVG